MDEATQLIEEEINAYSSSSGISAELIEGSVEIINSTDTETYVSYNMKEVAKNPDTGESYTYNEKVIQLFVTDSNGNWVMGTFKDISVIN